MNYTTKNKTKRFNKYFSRNEPNERKIRVVFIKPLSGTTEIFTNNSRDPIYVDYKA